MKKAVMLFLLLAVCLAVNSGCASIISDSKYSVRIDSEPEGAEYSIIDKKGNVVHSGTTPETTPPLKAGAGFFSAADYQVTVKKEGYPEQTVPLKQNLDNWYLFGNLFFGGLIGYLIVDPITGAMWELKDTTVNLETGAVSDLPMKNELRIVLLDQVPKELRPRMVRIQ